jgi:hypothetical protein
MSTSERDNDRSRGFGPDHPQRLLIIAYTRLMLLPQRGDSSRATWITTVGDCELRLLEVPPPEGKGACSLSIELFDHAVGRVIEGRDCRDLNEAAAVTECFVAMARQRHTPEASRYFDPVTGESVEVPLGGRVPCRRT